MTRRRAVGAAAVVIMVGCGILTSCSPGGPLLAPHVAPTQTVTLEHAVHGYNEMLAELRGVVSAEYPHSPWRCDAGGAAKTGGVHRGTWTVSSPLWISDAVVSADPRARDAMVARMNGVLRAHGFIPFVTVQADTGSFDYIADDRRGSEVRFTGGSAASGLSYTTGDLPSSDPSPQSPLGPELSG